MSTELTPYTGLLDVTTGELLEPSITNAARVLNAARTMENQLRDLKAEATAYLVERAREQGTKTLHALDTSVEVSGGPTVVYDPVDLREALELAGCPQERIDEAIKTEVTYKVNRSVLKQLVAANPDYAAAVELATRTVDKPWRATVTR